jgi:SAM-dependent methyltransferase
MATREELRSTFDEVATTYDEVRPGYPLALFDEIVAVSAIPEGGRILEIGCGTGQATLPLATRGYRMTCVEMGESLAAVGRTKLAGYPKVEVQTSSFETWPLQADAFDVVISAQAFHWIDPAVSYEKVGRALRDGGTAALFWNLPVAGPDGGDFFEAVQEVYRKEAPELFDARSRPNEGDIAPYHEGLSHSRWFLPVQVRRYPWSASHDAAGYVRLLSTYSDHRRLAPEARERLFAGIVDLMETKFGGRIVKNYSCVLYLAQRRDVKNIESTI